jgi:hypothetical protein
MFPTALLLVPALVCQVPEAPLPGLVEVAKGVFVMKGVPGPGSVAALKRLKITHVLDLRRDGDAPGEALRVCAAAGMVIPETTEAVRSYLRTQGPT